MHPFRLIALASLLTGALLGGASQAFSDEVLLKNGATFEGKILSDSEARIVIRTTAGAKLTLPRKLIAKVIRKDASPGAELFFEGRRALKRGKRARAIEFFRRAAVSKDESAVRASKDELQRLAAGGETTPKARRRSLKPGEDPFDLPEPEAIVRELTEAADGGDVQARRKLAIRLYQRARVHEGAKRYLEASVDYERAAVRGEGVFEKDDSNSWREAAVQNRLRVARDAIRERSGRLALAAVGPVSESSWVPAGWRASAAYLHGRALELSNRRDEAIKAYAKTFGKTKPSRQDVGTYRELARLATVGIKIGLDSPGVGKEWRRIETRHFSILSQTKKSGVDLGKLFEEWRQAAADRLGLKVIPARDRIQVFFYRDRESYLRSKGARTWMAGHAIRLQAAHDENEVLRVIYFFTSSNDESTARHEIAHILTWDTLGEDAELPAWAVEGAAIYAEPARVRNWRLRSAAKLRLDPTRSALARMLFPAVNTTNADLNKFYTQSGINFGLLADKLGVKRTFKIALLVNKSGPARALGSEGLKLSAFEKMVEKALGGPLPQPKKPKSP
ncbi:MAG: hypothetical protein JKY65_25435 [Planctomycetes bacterium]|nr:hypothetical protein [Planctomycetota bacterium]